MFRSGLSLLLGVLAMSLSASWARSAIDVTQPPDHVRVMTEIPWEQNKQWLQLASHSGTTLFVSWKVELMDDQVKAAIKEAFATAAKPQPVARPMDWMETRTPVRWMIDGREETFAW